MGGSLAVFTPTVDRNLFEIVHANTHLYKTTVIHVLNHDTVKKITGVKQTKKIEAYFQRQV